MIDWLVRIFFWFGLFLNCFIVLPQIIKLILEKNAHNLSAFAFIGFWLLQLSMAMHAYFHNDLELLIGMLASMVTTGLLVILIFYYNYINKRSPAI